MKSSMKSSTGKLGIFVLIAVMITVNAQLLKQAYSSEPLAIITDNFTYTAGDIASIYMEGPVNSSFELSILDSNDTPVYYFDKIVIGERGIYEMFINTDDLIGIYQIKADSAETVVLKYFEVISGSPDPEDAENETGENENADNATSLNETIATSDNYTVNVSVEGNVSGYNNTLQNETNFTVPEMRIMNQPQMYSMILEIVTDFLRKIGQTLNISALLTYMNGTPIPDQTVSFYMDEMLIGSNRTDESGWARMEWNVSEISASAHSLNVSFQGNGTLNVSASYNDENIITITDETIVNEAENTSLEMQENETRKADEIDFVRSVFVRDSRKRAKEYDLRIMRNKHIVYEFFGNETYDVELEATDGPVRKISLREMLMKDNETIDLRIDDVPETIPAPEGKFWEEVYAIDPSNLSFANATVTSVAKGTELYKCQDWNFTEQKCYGQWIRIMDLLPGQEYSFELTPEDPAFGETDITIINVQSYPALHGNWTVTFNTTGQANLTITAVNGTSWSDSGDSEQLRFLEIMCGDEVIGYEWIGSDPYNSSIFIEN